jgi:hypothetical protein
MSSPFPGMNPYLESSVLWREVHSLLIVAIFDALNPQVRPKYRVAIEQRVYKASGEDSLLVGIPDVAVQQTQTESKSETGNVAVVALAVEPITVNLPMPETVRESYLEVREVATKEVVAVIEVLSPKNKRSGEGRIVYNEKRLEVLGSASNLVEIDLLRDGKPMDILDNHIQSDYSILVSSFKQRPQADLYAFNLKQTIPKFPLPLREGDKEPIVDLQELINGIYERASYDLVIDYSQEAVPELSEEDKIWVDDILKEQKLR